MPQTPSPLKPKPKRHAEGHRSQNIGWLRAAVLGANDGIVSTASLMIGMATAGTGSAAVLASGVAGLVAGAMSMAAGEYVSVHSQSDTEKADLRAERAELKANPLAEMRELQGIYVGRGLTPELAETVAKQLMQHDALGAHARDELGINATHRARPAQAAWASATSFAVGAALPLGVAWFVPAASLPGWVAGSALLSLAALGALAARAGGAPILPGATRVLLWGALAMAVTAGAGLLFGAIG